MRPGITFKIRQMANKPPSGKRYCSNCWKRIPGYWGHAACKKCLEEATT